MEFTLLVFLALLVVALVRVLSLWFLSIAYSFRRASAPVASDRISVIVPAFNEEKSIASSIDSLLSQDYGNYEVVIVDDGSSDRTFEVAKGFEGPKVKVIHQDNRGKSEALNTGIRACSGSIILTVDADTRLNQGALTALARRFASDPKLGALSGNVKVDRPRGLLQRLQEVEYTAGIGLNRKGQSMLSTVMIVPGPIAAFKKEAVEKVGYFSPHTFAEDFDITLAILRERYRVQYEDAAIAYTIAPRGVEDLLKQRRRWYRGMMQVLAKHEDMFFRKRYGIAGLYGIPYMWYDTVSPIINLFLALFAVIAGFASGDWAPILYGLAGYWVLQTVVAVSAIALDKERRPWQIVVSPLLIFYSTFLDGIRAAAFMEEVLSLRMKWEKPAR
ncbi:MAG: glycosyltransferase family 2 protein [Nitrososphaerota archaeon]|nr:glycosyltransferase family 2 protein [Nitrososphaerota archaeon]